MTHEAIFLTSRRDFADANFVRLFVKRAVTEGSASMPGIRAICVGENDAAWPRLAATVKIVIALFAQVVRTATEFWIRS